MQIRLIRLIRVPFTLCRLFFSEQIPSAWNCLRKIQSVFRKLGSVFVKLQREKPALFSHSEVLHCKDTAFSSKRKGLSRLTKHNVTNDGAGRYPLPVLFKKHIYTHTPFLLCSYFYIPISPREIIIYNKIYLPWKNIFHCHRSFFSLWGNIFFPLKYDNVCVSVFLRERVTGNAFWENVLKKRCQVVYLFKKMCKFALKSPLSIPTNEADDTVYRKEVWGV